MEQIKGLPQTQINWNELAGKIDDAKAVMQTAKASPARGGAPLSVSDGAELPRAVAASVPEIEAPAVTDVYELETLAGKIDSNLLAFTETQQKEVADQVLASYKEALSTFKPATGSGAIFDIYQLVALMLTVAQKQRDATRDIRKAENAAIQQSIQNQAESQRTAAIAGMAAGMAVCALQIGIQVIATVKMSTAYGKQADVAQSLNQTEVQADLKAAKAAHTDAKAEMLAGQKQLDTISAMPEGPAKAQALSDFMMEHQVGGEDLASVRANYEAKMEARVSGLDAEVVRLRADLGTHESLVNAHTDYQKAGLEQSKWRAYSDIASAAGSALQSAVHGVTELVNAKATAKSADRQEAEEQLEQIKDIFSQSQDVINKVLQLMSAVIQAETQSMRDAIHA